MHERTASSEFPALDSSSAAEQATHNGGNFTSPPRVASAARMKGLLSLQVVLNLAMVDLLHQLPLHFPALLGRCAG